MSGRPTGRRAGAAWLVQAALAAAAAAAGPAAWGGPVLAAPPERYLVIGASDTSPAAIARRARALEAAAVAAGDGPGLVLSAADCAGRDERRPVFAWAAGVADSAAEAQALLARLQARVPDAYLRRCQPRPGSLLALGLPAVDPSIAGVPDDVVNWTDEDRISRVVPLGPGAAAARLVLQRRHEPAPEDPLEGRRTRVLLVPPGAAPQVLLDDCGGAQGAVLARGRLALACDSEQAAEWVLHTVHVFSAAGTPVLQVPRCRAPRLLGAATLQCQAETVDAQGRLRLAPRSVPLPRP